MIVRFCITTNSVRTITAEWIGTVFWQLKEIMRLALLTVLRHRTEKMQLGFKLTLEKLLLAL